MVFGAMQSVPLDGALRQFSLTFGHVPVKALSEEASADLVGHLVLRYRVEAAAPAHLTREVLRRGEGNPAALRAMLHDAAAGQMVSAQDVRDLQARDDARRDQGA